MEVQAKKSVWGVGREMLWKMNKTNYEFVPFTSIKFQIRSNWAIMRMKRYSKWVLIFNSYTRRNGSHTQNIRVSYRLLNGTRKICVWWGSNVSHSNSIEPTRSTWISYSWMMNPPAGWTSATHKATRIYAYVTSTIHAANRTQVVVSSELRSEESIVEYSNIVWHYTACLDLRLF